MHLVDGVLSLPVVAGASAIAAAGTALGIRQLPAERLPEAALGSAVFFVASLIHVPLGPSSVHLMMNGLAGLVLGWAAFPALLVSLLMQAVFFGFGGLTVLGVNTVIMALPAVLAGTVARRILPRSPALAGAIAGGGSVTLAAACCSLALALSGKAFLPLAQALVIAHVPVIAIEAFVTAAAVQFLVRVRPSAVLSAEAPAVSN